MPPFHLLFPQWTSIVVFFYMESTAYPANKEFSACNSHLGYLIHDGFNQPSPHKLSTSPHYHTLIPIAYKTVLVYKNPPHPGPQPLLWINGRINQVYVHSCWELSSSCALFLWYVIMSNDTHRSSETCFYRCLCVCKLSPYLTLISLISSPSYHFSLSCHCLV